MRLKTILHLASFFPIFLSALFILHLLTIQITIVDAGGANIQLPTKGAILMAVFSLMVGWSFYRAGHNLVKQVGTLEHMAESVKHGDLNSTDDIPSGKGEVAAVARVFSELVVELRGYVALIRAHEQLKNDCDAAHASAERLRETAIKSSNSLELLRRAEQGTVQSMIEKGGFLLTWLPDSVVQQVFSSRDDNTKQGLDIIPSDIMDLLRELIGTSATALSSDAPASTPKESKSSLKVALDDADQLCRWKWTREGIHKAIDIAVNTVSAGPFDIQADRRSIIQALAALFTNAAEAMPNGGLITAELQSDSRGTVSLAITDHGKGMQEAIRNRCTKPFFSTKEGHLGMGLPLASRLTIRCGGRFGIISEAAHGTTVHISFSPHHHQQNAETTTQHAKRGPLDILLVEDDGAARETLVTLLKLEKHYVTAVEDGAVALLKMQNKDFDLILTDRAMPIMTGEELAAVVKARSPKTPVVLVTASGEAMERQHLQPEGVDVILPKPVLLDDLRLAINRAMDQTVIDTV